DGISECDRLAVSHCLELDWDSGGRRVYASIAHDRFAHCVNSRKDRSLLLGGRRRDSRVLTGQIIPDYSLSYESAEALRLVLRSAVGSYFLVGKAEERIVFTDIDGESPFLRRKKSQPIKLERRPGRAEFIHREPQGIRGKIVRIARNDG